MEFSILYAIPRNEWLDALILGSTSLAGSYGQLWLAIGIALLLLKKTRRVGIALLISYFGVFVFGQFILKNLIARPRPCQLDLAFPLLLERPTSTSFPSTHSGWAFAGATVIFLKNRKIGILAILFAALVAFGRMYLFLHFPTDVLCGILLGTAVGFLAIRICDRYFPEKDPGKDREPERENDPERDNDPEKS